jgi:NhaA family Na+:H+ antiporter
MAIFFFVIGLEIKRELIAGELSSVRKAMLPAGAALGGMVVPALIYFAFNPSGLASNGWGVPMATDIAFSLGLLTLVKSRVPVAVKVFLAGLAIVDDLGAVLVIAIFYTSKISFLSLGFAGLGLVILFIANRMGVRNVVFYGIIGIGVIWFSFLMSGVHATLAGVVAAFTIPSNVKLDERSFVTKLQNLGKEMETSAAHKGHPLITHHQLLVLDRVQKLGREADTPLQRLEHKLNPFVNYFVMPVFALANAGVALPENLVAILFHPVSLGCMIGLLVGKFIGISGFSRLLVRAGLASLPRGTAWSHIYGAALMAGIGFTMSLFITNLAFVPDHLSNPDLIAKGEEFETFAKVGVLTGSLISLTIGLLLLRFGTPDPDPEELEEEH